MPRDGLIEVCDYLGSYPGNFVPSLLAVSRAVEERLDLDVTCVFPEAVRDRPWTGAFTEAGLGLEFMPNDSRRAALRRLSRIADRVRPRLLRSHYTGWDLEAGLVGRRHRARVVWHIRTGNIGYPPRQRARDLVKVRTLGRVLCDRVFAVSEEIGRESRMRGFPAGKVRVVLNGIDMSRFEARGLPSRETARGRLGLSADTPLALAFGWNPYRKGVDVLVDAAAQRGRMGRLVTGIVGTAELREFLAQRYGDPLPPWLRVIEPDDDVAQLFAAADVFVSASREEAFSYAIGEAMSCGLPVISSDIPGPAAYFGAPSLERFANEDAADLARALDVVLDDGRKVNGANRAFVAENLALERHVDRVVAEYSELLGRR